MSTGTASIASTLADYARQAEARLPAAIWHYLQDGAGDDRTRHANEAAFDALALLPRPLADVRGGHTRIELFGRPYAHPLMLAPIAYQRLFCPQGEVGVAMAAQAQQAVMLISSLASQPLAEIAATGVDAWFQLYWQAGRDATLRLLRKAEDSGAQAIVFTVDAPVKQATLDLPAGLHAVNLEPAPQLPALAPGQSAVFDQWMSVAPRWDDLAWLRGQTRLPLLVKGLLHVDDAQRALDSGCDGLVVSNHGGRVIDGTPAALQVLQQFHQRFGDGTVLLLDSGLRSGADAFKAISCGARAVLIGRPYVWALAAAGPLGVAHVIRLLRDELEMTMALSGHASIDAVRTAGASLARRE
jgi:4-hydroxymandelate oxidase